MANDAGCPEPTDLWRGSPGGERPTRARLAVAWLTDGHDRFAAGTGAAGP